MGSDDESHEDEAEKPQEGVKTSPDPPVKKRRRPKLNEAQRLEAAGNMSKHERRRSSTPAVAQMEDELAEGKDVTTLAAEPLPRLRPEPGAMAEPPGGGVYSAHERPNSRGLLNWRNYGVLPRAKTVEVQGEQVKVYVWRGLFQEIDGRKVFAEQEDGPDEIEMSESKLDFWDSLRNRWLQKRYGKAVQITASRESFLLKKGFASLDYQEAETQYALSPDFMRTWHTREFISLLLCYK